MYEEDHYKIERILKIKDDVTKYLFFKRAIDLGITYSQNDVIFSDFMMFSWIKDGLDV